MGALVEGVRLSTAQIEILDGWWHVTRHNRAGYSPDELGERKPTLDALHAKGLLERPHRGSSIGWTAALTDLGRRVAEACAALLEEHEGNAP